MSTDDDLYRFDRQMWHGELRRRRMAIARAKGSHTDAEWEHLVAEFKGRCVRCGAEGFHLDRDHIVPVYLGGSNSIENIQPLCAGCNASKGPDDFDWVSWRRENGFGVGPL